MGHLCDLGPLVLRNLVHFALSGRLIWVLATRRKDEVLGTVLKALVQVSQLMSGATILHGCTLLSLIRLLVNHKTVSCDYCSNIVLLLLSTDAEDLVVHLDRGEVFRKCLSVSQADLCCCLRGKLVNHQLAVCVIVVVQARLVLAQDEVRLKADDIVEEATELVNFAAYDNIRARVFFKVALVHFNLLPESVALGGQLLNLVAQLQHGEEILFRGELPLFFYTALQVLNKGLQRREGLLREILRRRRILLNALQVLDRQKSLLSLLIDNRCELVVLVLDLLDNLFLDAFLLQDSVLHRGTLSKGLLCLVEQFVKLIDLQCARLLQCHAAATSTVLVEVAIVAESLVTDATVG